MTDYQDLHWDSLKLVKSHLYSRLATALDNAVGRMEIAQHVDDVTEIKAQFKQAVQGLAMALNLIKAWSVLVHVKTGGVLEEMRRQPIAVNALPEWLTSYLSPHVTLQLEAEWSVMAHPETFYESMVLMAQAGAVAGDLKSLAVSDARGGERGVWLRVVFQPPQEGRYGSLDALLKAMVEGDTRARAVALKLAVLADLCALNKAELRVQDNRTTGEQALAAMFPASARVANGVTGTTTDMAPETSAEPPTPLQAAGPVPAPTPHSTDVAAPPASDAQPAAGEGPSLAGPVAAPTPRLGDLVSARQAVRQATEMTATEEAATPGPDTPATDSVQAEQTSTTQDAASQVERNAAGEIENAPDTLIVPPSDFRSRLVQALREAEASLPDAPLPLGANAAIKATGALHPPGVASDEDSADVENAKGEGHPPDPVEPPDDAPVSHKD